MANHRVYPVLRDQAAVDYANSTFAASADGDLTITIAATPVAVWPRGQWQRVEKTS